MNRLPPLATTPPSREKKSDRGVAAFLTLSPRERDVLRLFVIGASSEMVRSRFGIEQRTVQWYRQNIRRKLGVETFAEAVELARPWMGLDAA